jgi:hypothetical protein
LQRVEFVFTPKHGSWLNMAEIAFAALTGQGLPERIAEVEQLQTCLAAWQAARNERGAPTKWRFTTDQARIMLRRLYPTI